MRIFVGLRLPPSHRVEFARIQSLLRPHFGDFRWLQPDQAHVTLHFIGEASRDRLPILESEFAQVAERAEPFEIEFGSIGVFPLRGHVRAAWVGVSDDSGRLSDLAARIAAAAQAPPPDRYRPHVTLGRPRRRNRMDLRAAIDGAHVVSGTMPLTVESFELIRSHLTPRGARYETIRRFDLGSG